jgi:hypothetical protein
MRIPFCACSGLRLDALMVNSDRGFGIGLLYRYQKVRQQDGDRMQGSIDATSLNGCRAKHAFQVFLRQMSAFR